MKTTNSIAYILKGISLLLLDVITLLIVSSAWAIINLPLFPWAIIAILFSLLAVNTIIWVSDSIIQSCGFPLYASILLVTGLYYLLIMVYTGVVYAVATPRGYLIMVLIFTLGYFLVMAGFYFSAIHHKADVVRQETEKGQMVDFNLRLFEIENTIKQTKTFIRKEQYDNMVNNFELMKERLLASTPIGRVTKPVIQGMDNKLKILLSELQDEIISLNNVNEHQNIYDNIIKELDSIKTLIINREKLIIQ